MNSRHSDSSLAHHIVIHWSFSRCKFKVYIITHIKEKPSTTNRYFSKIGKASEKECLQLMFICFLCKISSHSYWHILQMLDTSSLVSKRNKQVSRIFKITFAILSIYQKNTQPNGPTKCFGIYCRLMKPSNPLQSGSFCHKEMQNQKLANLKCVTYVQPIPLSLKLHCE